jgi:hypothetical protein
MTPVFATKKDTVHLSFVFVINQSIANKSADDSTVSLGNPKHQ